MEENYIKKTLLNRTCSCGNNWTSPHFCDPNSVATIPLWFKIVKPGPDVIKLFPSSTRLSIKFFPLINVKMPTIVGILTFMNMKNNIISLAELKKCWIFCDFYTYEHLKFHAQLSWAWKKFYNLGARSHHQWLTCRKPFCYILEIFSEVLFIALATRILLCSSVNKWGIILHFFS